MRLWVIFIHFLYGRYLPDYRLTQEPRRFDFHFPAMLENVHDQFAAVVKGDAELVIAIVQPLALLVGMPAFVSDPFGPGF